MKIEDIMPTPSKETRKTKKMYYNPKNGNYITYAQAYALKKNQGIDLFKNEVDVPNIDNNRLVILEEKFKFFNATLEMLQKVSNE
jgi:hypothetical protein